MAIDSPPRDSPRPTGIGNYYAPRALLRIDVPVEGYVGDTGGPVGLGGVFAYAGESVEVANEIPTGIFGIGGFLAASNTATGTTSVSTSDPITIFAPIRHMELVSNNHLEADTVTVQVDWRYLGVDPRILPAAVVTIYLGRQDTKSRTPWQPTDQDIRFVGIMKRSKRQGGEESGMIVEIMAHDYTTLFLEAKKFPTDGLPLFSETVSQAWARICAHTGVINPNNPGELLPTVKALSDSLDFVGEAKDVLLGSVANRRFQTLARMNPKPNSDAWAVWQECVGMLGLISYIRLDRCIVTTATDYYSETDTPVFVWGLNVETICEDRDTTLAGKGVHLQSFDPMSQTQIESYFPELGDPTTLRHKVSAKKATNELALLQASDYISFAYPGVSDQSALDRVCKNVYAQMAYQELEGRLSTSEMIVSRGSSLSIDDSLDPSGTVVANLFDMITLQAGDAITVLIDQSDSEALGQFGSDQSKIDYLVGQGYVEELAQIWVANLAGILALNPIYIVKKVQTIFDATGDHPKFTFDIAYCSKILLDGDSAPLDQKAPSIAKQGAKKRLGPTNTRTQAPPTASAPVSTVIDQPLFSSEDQNFSSSGDQ